LPVDPPTDPASSAAAAALASDPFYRCMTAELAADEMRRQAALGAYFDYSIWQGLRSGRVVHLQNAADGVAVWVLPQSGGNRARERARKLAFLRRLLGTRGCARYQAMVDYMGERSRSLVGPEAWYLSIIAVAPQAQGRGLGARLLAPTLAEADATGAVSYLETFNEKSQRFYERCGFITRAEFTEPTTGSQYVLMMRAQSRNSKRMRNGKHALTARPSSSVGR
jgi:GNAT superfamily N-acetyltransferase